MKNKLHIKTFILLSTLSLLAASGLVMAKENKVALVIGNKSYKDVPLKNSVNDAKDMKAALEKAGFTVIYAVDANQKKMDEAREKFVNALTKDSIGLFYYSGHGVQADGVNYLIPIDANIKSKVDLKYNAYDVNYFLDEMENAENPVNIVILDACRNNPYKGVRSISGGLANADAPDSAQGSLIAYATAPNSVADDNQKGNNGLYTKYLKQYLFAPGLTIEAALKKVGAAVKKENPDQIPWQSNSLTEDVCLGGCTSLVVKPVTPPVLTSNSPLLSFVSGNSSVEKGKIYTVNFKATDKDKDLSQIQIDWLDGSEVTSKNAVEGTALSFTHNYTFAGIYALVATALDNAGNVSKDVSKSVTVKEPAVVAPPVVKAPSVSVIDVSSQSITQGDSITFSANLSFALPLGYSVKLNYGNGFISMNGSGTNFNLTTIPNSSATYHVGVYDSKSVLKSNELTGDFTVVEPVIVNSPTLNLISSDSTATVGSTYTVKLSANDADGNLNRIFISWGDGYDDTQSVTINDTTITFTHTFNDAKSFTWQATASDSGYLNSPIVSQKISVSKKAVINTSGTSTSSGKLNDTGITTCSDGSNNGLACPINDHPNQDAQSGRDVTKNDNSDGHAGFSFTKISSTGATLSATATDWNCVKDNVTSLTWEIKTTDGGLHDWNHTYTWYEPDNTKNGGSSGTQNGGSCKGSDCDTNAYIKAVNAVGYCGYKDWRMPTRYELASIVDFSSYTPAIDTTYFPNTKSDWFWSSSPYAGGGNGAWGVGFYYGFSNYSYKNDNVFVRLVR